MLSNNCPKLLLIILCANLTVLPVLSASNEQECEFTSYQLKCVYQNLSHDILVELKTSAIGVDEFRLDRLVVMSHRNSSDLLITPDTTFVDGDFGYISFADINFDSIPDLAITTSFGTPSLYLDYWVYQSEKKQYVALGNFPKLMIDRQSRTLTADVKIDATTYQKKTWKWQGNKLVATD